MVQKKEIEMNNVGPNLFCLGPPKTGTTTLYDQMRNHPDVYLPEIKEPSFFGDDVNYKKGLRYYLNAYYGCVKNEKIVGDFSPNYYGEDSSLERIAKSCGRNVKFIIVVRDPVERAYSHYLHKVKDGVEKEKFIDAINRYESQYIQNSLYEDTITKIVDIFGRKNLLVLNFDEDINRNLNVGLEKICNFLDIAIIKAEGSLISNPSKKARPGMQLLRSIIHGDGIVKRILKKLLPAKTRQKIRLQFDEITTIEVKEKAGIDKKQAKQIYETYFKKDIAAIEKYIKLNIDGKYDE